MSFTRVHLATAGMVLCSALGMWIGRALATGAPQFTPLTYSGIVTDAAGKPYATAVDVSLAFFDAANGGTQKCKAPAVQCEPGTGVFSVVLPKECADAVHEKAELWSEATVGPAKLVLPRTHVGAVPYALEAESAKAAQTASAATGPLQLQIAALQAKVDGLSAAGAGANGGVRVFDGKDTYLGTLVVASPNNQPGDLVVMTPKGFMFMVSYGGEPKVFAFYFAKESCQGNIAVNYYDFSLVSNPYVPGKFLAYRKIQNQWLVTSPATANFVKTTDFLYISGANGSCNKAPAQVKTNAILVEPISNADAGLPTSIAPGLYFKP